MTLLEAEPTRTLPRETTPSVPGAPAPGTDGRGRSLEVGRIVSSATTVLAVMLLVFVAEMAVVGPVRHAREQAVLYQEFRSQMANSVAPTGQVGAVRKKDAGYVLDEKALVPLGAPVALMKIPAIGLKEVVAQGTTSTVLASGPGHRRDTAFPGQPGTVIIMGRQATYGGPFRKIAKLTVGDEIVFATGQGNSLYTVTGVRRAGDKAPVPDATTARLTLMTGDGTPYLPSDVVRVDAVLKSETFPSATGPITAASLASSEQAMAGDRSALIPLLLWSQLLLLLSVLLSWVRGVWGPWQSWLVSVPMLGFVGFKVAGLLALLLPNVL